MDIIFPLDDPYGPSIRDAVTRLFPPSVHLNHQQVFEAVAAEILGSNKHRFGPMPNPESQVAIRSVVQTAMRQGLPIPILCPWGSKKPGNDGIIDIAELSGLRMLDCLQRRVVRYYTPGLDIRLRLEDVGGFYLFRDEGEPARVAAVRYVADFEMLVRILGLSFIETVREADLMTEATYVACADALYPKILQYLEDTDVQGIDGYERLQSWKELQAEGWQGEIPVDQRDFYRQRYARIYGADLASQNKKFAEYLAGSLARYKLKATGIREGWERNFIQLNFAPPAPGAPQGIIERRVHYRTVHTEYSRDHVPPWRAKGYYRITNEGTPTPAVTSWFDTKKHFNPCELILSGGSERIQVQTDYVLA